jgi:hypothetical protein
LADLQTRYVHAEPCPYRIRRAVKADFTEHVYCLRYEVPIPLEFSILLGEIVYNLRSALDQCVFQLALNHTGIEHNKTMFPIFATPVDFRTKGKWRIKDIGVGPMAFIRSLQPYSDRRQPVHYSLLDLNNLSNADKHRVSQLWGFSFGLGKTEIVAGAALVPSGLSKILHDGAEICRVLPETPTDEMQVSGSLEATLSIKNPTAARRGVSTNLWNVIADVRFIVDALVGSLGQQDLPIEVDWPAHESLIESGKVDTSPGE